MIKNEVVVITMSKQELDDYIEKYKRSDITQDREKTAERLTQKQAAALFGVTPATIIRWQKKGEIPVNKVGRTVFYFKDQLLEVAKKNPAMLK
ncbi:helix-turn-helix domain-containing protein [Pontibacter chitinilyticus]|uniref:helix-turn-helix domain-containing protein n=1 Tax=Pontibacter chitinilyticus TaxID=2674989 RepID=UPI00321BBC1F